MLERLFNLREAGTAPPTELIGGATTVVTLSYIIFAQPAVLGVASMDFGAVMVATCLAGAFETAVMGLYANYPIAVAPAMGYTFFVAYTVVVGMGVPWRVALGVDFVAVTVRRAGRLPLPRGGDRIISYALLQTLGGRARSVRCLAYLFAALFLQRLVLA